MVTSFDYLKHKSFAADCLNSFEKYWPENVRMDAYVQNSPSCWLRRSIDNRLQIFDFEAVKSFYVFANKFKEIADTKSGFRYDAIRFAHKIFAIREALDTTAAEFVIWIDADVSTTRPVTLDFLHTLCSKSQYLSFLGREHIANPALRYPECGFMIFNTKHPDHNPFWELLRRYYDEGNLFALREWHDSYVINQCRLACERELGTSNFDITSLGLRDISDPAHVFVASVLGEYMDHRKGNRKNLKQSPERESR